MFYKFSVSASGFHHLACCAMLALTLAACGADNTSGMAGQSTTTSQAGSDFFVNGVPPRTSVRVGAMYKYVPAAASVSGRVLSYQITNKPEWATFGETNGELSGIPSTADIGTSAAIQIGVSDGTRLATVGPFRIIVTPQPTPTPTGPPPPAPGTPTIAGTPASTVTAGQLYRFVPTVTDPSGEALSFSIVNRPAWATFNPATGALSGNPTTANVGSFANILISVSTSGAPVSLATFAIQVQSSSDSAPTISGSPAATVAAGGSYSFTPAAGDPDGNALTFSILNAPSWATFSTQTGELSGTAPAGATAQLFSNIVISVSDGTLSASLPAFSVQVQAQSGGGSGGGKGIKFHPGYYIELDLNDSLSGWLATIASLKGAANLKGVSIIVTWSQLEFAEGVYTGGAGSGQGFDMIDQLLAACKAAGLQFIMGYEDRAFGGPETWTTPSSFGTLPPYFDNLLGSGQPGYIDAPSGTTLTGALKVSALVTNPAVTAREIALAQAYGARYDSNPNFEMWFTPETSNGYFTSSSQYDAYVAQLQAWMQAARAAFPTSGIRISTNFLDTSGEFTTLFNTAITYSIGVGGPDTKLNMPGTPPFPGTDSLTFNGYEGGVNYSNVLMRVAESQTVGGGSPSMAALNAEYFTGSPITGGSTKPNYWIWCAGSTYQTMFTLSDILSFIAAGGSNPTYPVNTTRPSSYQ